MKRRPAPHLTALSRLWLASSSHGVRPASVISNALQEFIESLKRHIGSFQSDFGNESPLIKCDGPGLRSIKLKLTGSLIGGMSIRHAQGRMIERSPLKANAIITERLEKSNNSSTVALIEADVPDSRPQISTVRKVAVSAIEQ